LENNRIKEKNASIIIKSYKVFKKFEIYKSLSDNEIKTLVANNIGNFFPIDINGYVTDYETLYKEKKTTGIMVVAVAKQIITTYLNLLEGIGLNCTHIDFYQNVVSKYISKYFKTKTLAVFKMSDKHSFIYISNGKVLAMRDIFLDFSKDAVLMLNQGLGFFSDEIYSIDNILLLDDLPNLEQALNIFTNANFYNKERLSDFLSIDIDMLAFQKL
jgi:Tfp pilus assembly PilM family ATPase